MSKLTKPQEAMLRAAPFSTIYWGDKVHACTYADFRRNTADALVRRGLLRTTLGDRASRNYIRTRAGDEALGMGDYGQT